MTLFVSLQSKMDSINSELVVQFHKMTEWFDQLKLHMSVTKKVNTPLSKRLQTIEKQCWTIAQYFRRDTIMRAGVKVSRKDTEGCHQVGKRGLNFVEGRYRSKF